MPPPGRFSKLSLPGVLARRAHTRCLAELSPLRVQGEERVAVSRLLGDELGRQRLDDSAAEGVGHVVARVETHDDDLRPLLHRFGAQQEVLDGTVSAERHVVRRRADLLAEAPSQATSSP